MIGVTSYSMTRIPNLEAFLGCESARLVTPWNLRHMRAIVGWGLKPSGARARRLAASRGLPALLVEDGFLRSTARNGPPLSLIIDDVGMYYDASQPSTLDHFLDMPFDEQSRQRAAALIKRLRETSVSKYNAARVYDGELPDHYVLVADQVHGDLSVTGGRATAEDFAIMLADALAENPAATIVVKLHPDVLSGRATGYLQHLVAREHPRLHILDRDADPASLIRHAHAVYTVSSQLGFDAIIHGCRPHVYGMPFYAGRGLTQDRQTRPQWRRTVELEHLVYASLVQYCRYIDPETGAPTTAEIVVEHLALQRRMRSRLPKSATAIGIPQWKRAALRRFLPGVSLNFASNVTNFSKGDTLILWGNRPKPAELNDVPILRFEDGFIRSAGLGVELATPLSWCSDDLGIHYDPARPSRLERLLAESHFDEMLLQRAARLRETLRATGITKYNLTGHHWQRPGTRRRILLVAGQVESDAALEAKIGITSDAALLAKVRQENPAAWIIYKPHPDIVSGIRRNHGPSPNEADYDEILPYAHLSVLLEAVDEVHVMTSLTGFEALIRGRRVVCHGQPFYSGWGLTIDRIPISRRTRILSIDELVAAALILYPLYINQRSREFTEIESVIETLSAHSHASPSRLAPWYRCLRPVLRFANMIRERQSARQRMPHSPPWHIEKTGP